MRILVALLLVIQLVIAPEAVQAAVQLPKPSAADPRIKTYVYAPDAIYSYKGYYRYASSIEFEYGEEIQQIAMGDNTGWQVTPAGRRLFLKPTDEEATTNMTIFTNQRIYFFELYAGEATDIRDSNLSFVTRFTYPDSKNSGAIRRYVDEGAKEKEKLSKIDNFNPEVDDLSSYNFSYSVSGSETVTPLRIFDDGEFTYLQFETLGADIPAIFHVNKYAEESLVNYRISGDYVIIERVASQFTLRLGEHVACVFNEKRPLPKVQKKKFLGVF